MGYTRTLAGLNGTRKVCTDSQGNIISNEVTTEPYNETVYIGTYTTEQALKDSVRSCQLRLNLHIILIAYRKR